ncbi:MAG: hypothetical protein H0Z19_11800 [Archaeoglobus sp.]|uniref:hypothetical protein n=1 Tax=Archaeoglobus sp. TaxID=1872626 RepID=UPI001E07FBFC|nr:hypothetical protein [Archaeoglobus sp.]MBO8181132.1 hypothetical protein [Archaeoglobus sp.]
MGFLDSLKRGSFIASFGAVKETFDVFLSDYLRSKAELKMLEGKPEFKARFITLQTNIEAMDTVLDEVKAWCVKTIKKIDSIREVKE